MQPSAPSAASSAPSTAASPATSAPGGPARTLPVVALATLVVGTMVGAGVYSLPANFAASTGVVGTLIAWIVSGLGTLMLALVFQRLAVTRPELDSGIFAYAKAGFGDYVGFFSAFGYWASAVAGNGTYVVLIGSTLGQAFPILGEGNTPASAVLSTAILWAFHLLIVRGVRQAALVNTVVTIAKIVPIVVFIVLLVLLGMHWQLFADNLWASGTDASGGAPSAGALFGQVRSTMLVAVFVFLGVEGASVYSRYARRRSDVGRATMLGFGSVLVILMLVTLVAYAALPVATLAGEHQPSMAGVLSVVVGPWGGVFVSVGLLVSVLGAFLAWTLMAAEVFFNAAKGGDAPAVFARTNRAGVPHHALLLTTLAVQALVVVSLFSQDAFQFCLLLCASLAVVPYVLTAGFAVREAVAARASAQASVRPVVLALLALVYTLFLVYATGVTYLLISAIVYAPASLLFARARRARGLRVFRPWEAALAAFVTAAAVAGVVALAAGWISI
ncbi:basic amino acid/polyamine antiporter [Gryllotalpicola ginsengisoli]|uniref:basic amino acid/polyamine antiporter n=1 Tax=Gryllotalpicola ginsengisoli TaxID=444608 RepID=UPI0003B3D5A9|nr:basic amino acid/polyamine antiporter [Gryllotalpicola ginsengisoli]